MSVTEPPPEMEVEVRSCLVGGRGPCVFFFWGGEKMKMRFLCGQKSDKTKLR